MQGGTELRYRDEKTREALFSHDPALTFDPYGNLWIVDAIQVSGGSVRKLSAGWRGQYVSQVRTTGHPPNAASKRHSVNDHFSSPVIFAPKTWRYFKAEDSKKAAANGALLCSQIGHLMAGFSSQWRFTQ